MRRVFLVTFLFFLLLLPRDPWGGAARLHVASARSLAMRGDLDIAGETPVGTWVHGGRRYALLPLGPSLLLLPLEAALRLFSRTEAGARVGRVLEAASSAAGAALLCSLFFSTLLSLGARRRLAFWASLALAGTTTVAVYARIPDGSVWAALLLLIAVEQARKLERDPHLRRESSSSASRRALLLGTACGALALFDLTWPALVILGWTAVFTKERRALGWSLLPMLTGLALVFAHQRLMHALPEPRGDLSEGLDGLLLSTGKSVFAYSPPLVFALMALPFFWRQRRSHAVLICAVAAAMILPAALLERWDADPAWGPRRLVPLVPLVLVPVALYIDALEPGRLYRATLALVLATGLFVQIIGAAFPPETYLRMASLVKNTTGASGWFYVPDQTHFIPQFSPLGAHTWLLSHVIRHDKKLEAKTPWAFLAPTSPKLDSEWPRVHLDWWATSLLRGTVPK